MRALRVTTCRTGAISMPGADLSGLAAEVDTYVVEGVDDLAIVCERRSIADGHPPGRPGPGPQAVASLPCIPIIGPGALLGLMTSATRIRVEACDDCNCRDVIEANTTFVDRLASVLGPPG